MGWRSLLGFAGSPPILSPCLCVVPRPWCRGRVPFPSGFLALVSVWWPLQWKVARVVAWQLGCGGGLCGALGGPLSGRDLVWFLRCRVSAALARVGGRSPLGWSVLCPCVAVSPEGLAVFTGCWGVGWCWSLRCGVSLPRPSSRPAPSLVLWPLPCPAPSVGGPLVVPCPRVVLPAVPSSRGCVPITWFLSSPPCCGPSSCPLPFRCPGGGVVATSVGRRWPMPGVWAVWSHRQRVLGV